MPTLNRRDFLKWTSAGAAAMAVPGWMAQATVQGAAAGTNTAPGAMGSRPNFIVILIDDMGYGDIEPYGSKVNRTPNLNRMAAEGMKLTSFYAAPVCTPSRAQVMTGCYAKRVSLPAVLPPSCSIGLNPEEKTVARLLKDRGYATMCIGKWHLGDQPEFLPTRHGFDHYVGLPYSNDMGGAGKKATEGKGKRPPLPLLRDEKVVEAPADQDKLTALYTREAVSFIQANQNKPFFLYFPHTAVHVPLHPGKDFDGKSGNGRFADWVAEVDWSVGQVLQTLRDLNLDRNTLVLFTSDNGPWLTQGKAGGTAGPLRGGKGSCWEGGVREPMLAWWPGRIAAGSSCDAVTSETDILPTLVKMAGGTVPADRKIDGLDVWPLLAGQTRESPREALFYFNGGHLEGVRSGPWKLLNQRLYNLDKDIGETTDVANQNTDVVKRLQSLIAKMDADLGVSGKGPGVRPNGKVATPKPLVRDAREYN
jgi:arylsulfatase A